MVIDFTFADRANSPQRGRKTPGGSRKKPRSRVNPSRIRRYCTWVPGEVKPSTGAARVDPTGLTIHRERRVDIPKKSVQTIRNQSGREV